jgi:uncharacterized protein
MRNRTRILTGACLLVLSSGPLAEAMDLGKELRLAAAAGDTERMAILLDQGADVNGANPSGQTALMAAAEKGDILTAALLLTRGADVNARTQSGLTALTFAAENGNIGMTALLIERGALLHDRTREGWDPLMIASRYGIRDMVEQLSSGAPTPRPQTAMGARP